MLQLASVYKLVHQKVHEWSYAKLCSQLTFRNNYKLTFIYLQQRLHASCPRRGVLTSSRSLSPTRMPLKLDRSTRWCARRVSTWIESSTSQLGHRHWKSLKTRYVRFHWTRTVPYIRPANSIKTGNSVRRSVLRYYPQHEYESNSVVRPRQVSPPKSPPSPPSTIPTTQENIRDTPHYTPCTRTIRLGVDVPWLLRSRSKHPLTYPGPSIAEQTAFDFAVMQAMPSPGLPDGSPDFFSILPIYLIFHCIPTDHLFPIRSSGSRGTAAIAFDICHVMRSTAELRDRSHVQCCWGSKIIE